MKEKIYLIPGLMTDQRLWSRLKPFLTEYELIHLPIPLYDNFDNIIEEINKHIISDKINLLGFSLGGYIASYYTIKNPNRVNKLFLLSSTPSNTEEKDLPRRIKKLQNAKENGFVALQESKAIDLLEKKDDNELVETTCSMFNDLGNEHFISQLASTLNREDLYTPLSKLSIPITFYYSDEDRLLNHQWIQNVKEKNNSFKMINRKGTSHNISLEFPEQLSKEIKIWMDN